MKSLKLTETIKAFPLNIGNIPFISFPFMYRTASLKTFSQTYILYICIYKLYNYTITT